MAASTKPPIPLPKAIIEEIYLYLGSDHVDQILSCGCVAKEWNRACASDSTLWKRLAEQRYGVDLAHSSLPEYDSWNALVKDDNTKGAFKSKRCTATAPALYQRNRVAYYFCCEVLELRWNRYSNTFWIHINARGEQDLRHPRTSWLAITVGPNAMQIRRPVEWCPLLPDRPSHYRGWLGFDVSCEIRGYRRHGLPMSTEFWYANMPHRGADYNPVTLWKDLPLEEFFQDGCYTGTTFATDVEETEEQERRRWEGRLVPQNVLSRHTLAGSRLGSWWSS